MKKLLKIIFIAAMCSLFTQGCSSTGNSGSIGVDVKPLPSATSAQIGYGFPYYMLAESNLKNADTIAREFSRRGITILPFELSSMRGRPAGTTLADNVRDMAAWDKACKKYNIRLWVWLWNSNNGNEHNPNHTTLGELKSSADLFVKLYGKYHYFNAMSENDQNTPEATRNSIRSYVSSIYKSGPYIVYGKDEHHLQGLLAKPAQVSDSCGSIAKVHPKGGCKDTNPANESADGMVKLFRPWYKKGHIVVKYDFSNGPNYDAAEKFVSGLK